MTTFASGKILLPRSDPRLSRWYRVRFSWVILAWVFVSSAIAGACAWERFEELRTPSPMAGYQAAISAGRQGTHIVPVKLKRRKP
jgi:hypothetical protein